MFNCDTLKLLYTAFSLSLENNKYSILMLFFSLFLSTLPIIPSPASPLGISSAFQ